MKKNLGTIDRVLRLVLAIIIGVAIFLTDSIIIQIFLAGLSLFILYEALASWCLLYALIGRNTCPIDLDNTKK